MGAWHFPDDTVAFLLDLKANNDREWFAQNKNRYEQAVKQPAKAFCAQMEAELQALTGLAHGSKVYRIHRDLRFSKDKTPYNPHLHISFHAKGAPAAWFFGLEPEQLVLGVGTFAFDKPALESYRNRVAGPEGTRLAALLESLSGEGLRIGEPELKRVPAGYAPDHASAALLRRKGLSAWTDLDDPDTAAGPNLIDSCVAGFGRVKPLFDWLLTAPTSGNR